MLWLSDLYYAISFSLFCNCLTSTDSPTKCVPLSVESCENAGYYYTADFPPIDGKPYQMVKEKSLKFFLDFLNVCSKYSSTIMCSLFMPKCMEGHPKPVMPCRSVCLEFVNKCHRLLSLASHAGLFRSLCDLLPEQDALLTTCFVPKGFTASTTSGKLLAQYLTKSTD